MAVRQLLDDSKAWIEYDTYPPDETAVRFHHRPVHSPISEREWPPCPASRGSLRMRLARQRFSWGMESLQ